MGRMAEEACNVRYNKSAPDIVKIMQGHSLRIIWRVGQANSAEYDTFLTVWAIGDELNLLFVAADVVNGSIAFEQHICRLVAYLSFKLGFTRLHYDSELQGVDYIFFRERMIAERCDYMDCGALHYPWTDTYKVHVNLKEFASKARKIVITDY